VRNPWIANLGRQLLVDTKYPRFTYLCERTIKRVWNRYYTISQVWSLAAWYLR